MSIAEVGVGVAAVARFELHQRNGASVSPLSESPSCLRFCLCPVECAPFSPSLLLCRPIASALLPSLSRSPSLLDSGDSGASEFERQRVLRDQGSKPS
ncbi:hypothetical protein LOK49_LG02G02807 [Camellia lanceoleosa]|uniref:Uncharacterized protein n=1 Tax=Camellia lanceoleosa TaxID=1840588 RepID=A0ACC0ILG4_9ERIC|nr:hypothetical protein LOK49_LG02G02807 [Camellia lanceoleosa]